MRADCLVMAKPAGPRCNLRCAYCYYLPKAGMFPSEPAPRMSDALLETYVRQRLAASPGPVTHFEWHGGEPTLLGLPFFQRVVELQRRHRPEDRRVTNGLQTNGLFLDEAWVRFLAREGFSVGLSLDGPAECHDAFRTTAAGEGTHARAVQAFSLLHRAGVHCDVLCVLHARNVGEPLEVYRFFRDLGVTYLQFLPLVMPEGGGVSASTPSPEALGAFLCRVFDEWVVRDLGRIVVQLFDEALRQPSLLPHALCIFRETCGEVAALEHDGSLYACDHFVDPEHRLGNILEQDLARLVSLPLLESFGARKRDALPRQCRKCDVLTWCRGGCPKDRIARTAGGEPGLNYLCPAYLRFFRHCRPVLARLAAHRRAGRPLGTFTP